MLRAGLDHVAPMQWTWYVKNNPAAASPSPGILLHPSDLDLVNDDVNSKISPNQDPPPQPYLPESAWTPWRSPGWCGDYAVTKRESLLRLGWPSSSLLLTICLTAFGEEHCVLACNSLTGQQILDNRVSVIRSPEHTGYKFQLIQDSNNPNFWHEVA
jgi:predicted transglutaminase-like cysteine proteinase